ncbi:MAG: SlyX family protein [Pseudomonadota bacterium]
MGMTALEQRVDELESRLAWQDESIEALNAAIAEQALAITQLEEKLKLLSQRLQAQNALNTSDVQTHEVPPHY